MSRNHDEEFSDTQERQYAYDFDVIIREHLLNRTVSFLNPRGLTLEVGAYMGDMTSQILERFPNLTVLEGSSILSESLKTRFGDQISLISGTIEQSLIETKFDNIFLVHTLEHLDDPVGSLTQA